MKSHYIIPIFIPEKACPFRCIYCNQFAIAHTIKSPDTADIKQQIELYLSTFPVNGIKKLGFFGGSFTGMPIKEQNQYLDVVLPYIERGDIQSIQLSTRPDYISEKILENLKRYQVELIELGVQSLDDKVLKASGRGHCAKDVEKASNLNHNYDFRLGLQMMLGLPEDSFEKTMYTAEKIIECGADCTRIYPTLVIKNTYLETLFLNKQYVPLSLQEAINQCKKLMKLFEKQRIKILRMGLHPSEGFISGKSLVAGPFHVSFKELVVSSYWNDLLQEAINGQKGEMATVTVSPKQLNAAIGYEAVNKKMLQQQFETILFQTDESFKEYEFTITF